MKLLAIIDSAGERRELNPRRIERTLAAVSRWPGVESMLVVRGSEAEFNKVANAIQTCWPGVVAVRAPESVMGSACMALLAADHIDERELCVVHGEQLLHWDLQRAIAPLRSAGVDVGAVLFESLDSRWPQARLGDGGEILEVQPGAAIGQHALAGVYYYQRGVEFRQTIEQMILKRKPTACGFELAPALNEAILSGQRVVGGRLSAAEALPARSEDEAPSYREMFFKLDRIQAAALRDKWFARAA